MRAFPKGTTTLVAFVANLMEKRGKSLTGSSESVAFVQFQNRSQQPFEWFFPLRVPLTSCPAIWCDPMFFYPLQRRSCRGLGQILSLWQHAHRFKLLMDPLVTLIAHQPKVRTVQHRSQPWLEGKVSDSRQHFFPSNALIAFARSFIMPVSQLHIGKFEKLMQRRYKLHKCGLQKQNWGRTSTKSC